MEEAELRDFFDTFFGTAAVLCSYVSFLYFGSQNNLGRYTVYISRSDIHPFMYRHSSNI